MMVCVLTGNKLLPEVMMTQFIIAYICTRSEWVNSLRRHICITNLVYHWFREWLGACSAPNHYLNQCCIIVNWTLGNKLQSNCNRNYNIFIQGNAFDKCHLWNGSHFASASMSWWLWHQPRLPVIAIDVGPVQPSAFVMQASITQCWIQHSMISWEGVWHILSMKGAKKSSEYYTA